MTPGATMLLLLLPLPRQLPWLSNSHDEVRLHGWIVVLQPHEAPLHAAARPWRDAHLKLWEETIFLYIWLYARDRFMHPLAI